MDRLTIRALFSPHSIQIRCALVLGEVRVSAVTVHLENPSSFNVLTAPKSASATSSTPIFHSRSA
jgi:hypothetical protein